MRVSTERAEEIQDLCHPGSSFQFTISEYADLAADLVEARRISGVRAKREIDDLLGRCEKVAKKTRGERGE